MPAKSPPKPKPATVGENIRRYRLAAQMSQLTLSHILGYTGDDAGCVISRFESGMRQPRVATVIKIAVALKVPVQKLISLP